jgi:hypothetical protein
MPGMDNTGPFGTGPVGRGLGRCGDIQAGRGRGRGFRRGGGAGWNMLPQTLSADDEQELLKQRKGWLEAQLAAITQRLQGFEKE